jgi:branched-chain amino acid transport system permease protein
MGRDPTLRIIAAAAALSVVVVLAALATLGPYALRVIDVTLINIVIALGLNIILGFGGQISLAQPAFFGISAYCFSLLELQGFGAALAALAAVALSALVGLVLGWPVLRLRGHYLALATLGFCLVVGDLLANLDFTGGANGLAGIPGVGLAGQNGPMLVALAVVAFLAFSASVALAHSAIGLRIRAYRDDELAAQAAGVDVRVLKIGLFVLSAIYAGCAGVAYPCLLGYISPDVFAWQTSFAYLAMVVVGGLGGSLGAVIGAVLYTFVPEWLRFLQDAYFAVFGLSVIAVVAVMPGGIAGVLASAWRVARRRAATP